MADTRAAKIPSPAHRETALCRVLPFVKKTAGCNAEWDAAVHQLHRLDVCTSCPGLPSLPTCLLACLPAAPALAHILQVRGPPSVWRRARRIFESLGHEPADI